GTVGREVAGPAGPGGPRAAEAALALAVVERAQRLVDGGVGATEVGAGPFGLAAAEDHAPATEISHGPLRGARPAPAGPRRRAPHRNPRARRARRGCRPVPPARPASAARARRSARTGGGGGGGAGRTAPPRARGGRPRRTAPTARPGGR